MRRRIRLYVRLLRLLPVAFRCVSGAAPRIEFIRYRSEVEACHRDLGHDYDRNVILREHEEPMA